MDGTFRGALSRAATRAIGSRFAKPIARVALAAAGLGLLAFIGHTAVAGAVAGAAVPAASAPVATAAPAKSFAVPGPAPSGPPAAVSPNATVDPGVVTSSIPLPSTRASADDPVVLNTASEADLRRLPGIGAKRADAILVLRSHLGRFHVIEDLLKVKGIGRATLKRLRPLIRLDRPPAEAGAPPAG